MKKYLLFMIGAFLLIGLSAKAGVITVSNMSNSPGKYTSLQVAIDAAVAGDTIFVTGSPTSYGSVNLTKRLILIGAGYNPSNQFGLKTILGTLSIQTGNDGFGGTTNPSGSEISGFEMTHVYSLYNDNMNNITFSRNRVTSQMHFNNKATSGWVVKNNILYSIDYCDNLTTTIFSNNIILGNFYSLKSPTITITNNIFTNTNIAAFNNVTYAIVTNNIFYGKTTAGANYCTFNNNISIGGAQTTFNYANNSAQGNFENQNPLFVSVAEPTFNLSYDYHLQASSPGYNAGTDGKHIGIYGGSFPFPGGEATPYQTSAMPAVPQVVKMNLQNSVLPVNGTLKVQIEAVSIP